MPPSPTTRVIRNRPSARVWIGARSTARLDPGAGRGSRGIVHDQRARPLPEGEARGPLATPHVHAPDRRSTLAAMRHAMLALLLVTACGGGRGQPSAPAPAAI